MKTISCILNLMLFILTAHSAVDDIMTSPKGFLGKSNDLSIPLTKENLEILLKGASVYQKSGQYKDAYETWDYISTKSFKECSILTEDFLVATALYNKGKCLFYGKGIEKNTATSENIFLDILEYYQVCKKANSVTNILHEIAIQSSYFLAEIFLGENFNSPSKKVKMARLKYLKNVRILFTQFKTEDPVTIDMYLDSLEKLSNYAWEQNKFDEAYGLLEELYGFVADKKVQNFKVSVSLIQVHYYIQHNFIEKIQEIDSMLGIIGNEKEKEEEIRSWFTYLYKKDLSKFTDSIEYFKNENIMKYKEVFLEVLKSICGTSVEVGPRFISSN